MTQAVYRVLARAEVDRLRRMQQTARQVRGATPADDVRRGVSVAYSARLAQHLADGYSVAYLASVVGVTGWTLQQRLMRHGHLPLSPSLARRGVSYLGKPAHETGTTGSSDLAPVVDGPPVPVAFPGGVSSGSGVRAGADPGPCPTADKERTHG